MKSIIFLIHLLILICFLPALAQWPTTVEENLPVAADSTFSEGWCTAQPISDGKIFVSYHATNYGICYQIIDRYGELLLPPYQICSPALPLLDRYGIPKSCLSEGNGVFVVWYDMNYLYTGIYAQKLDFLGN
jgi:hypothetical protein